MGCGHQGQDEDGKGPILNAPGTPMMIPSADANSSLRLTLFAGESSVRVEVCGIGSPTLMNAGRVEWKVLRAMGDLAAMVRGRRAVLNAILA